MSVRDAVYVDEVNKWKVVFVAMQGYLKDSVKLEEDRAITAEAAIIKFLKDYDYTTSLDIINNVKQSLRYDG
jgi:hypothetical protein|tara:strand:- start:459 stop:674 length:216 start_codon:yes stop_codon:yes gene_type:complete